MARGGDQSHCSGTARALNGVTTPIFYKGRQVGEHRRYNDRLAMFILSRRLPEKYGRAAEGRDFSGDVS